MYLLLIVIAYILIAIKFMNWSRWKEYYPTIQFYVIGDLLYNFVFYHHTLWAYKGASWKWLNHTFISLTFTFTVIPIALMFFLQYYPKGKKRFLYLFLWVLYFTLLELFFSKIGLFVYDNGWNLWWSALFNVVTFSMISLHFKKPVVALIISVPLIAVLLLFFHPLLHELK
ncbi:CBO0543 family protein [Rossellomorea aquimaris]|uniref:CBO0543 family protein n=1 Tax=Rossellomorea aquimaris TaxID=189382 RepID=UPI0007D0A3DA|nr:CBO0543 family protein [Rossellomorea aquimaris]